MSREDPQFKLRMTPELRAAIEQEAKANNRSMNAEIVAKLEESVKEKSQIDKFYSPEFRALIGRNQDVKKLHDLFVSNAVEKTINTLETLMHDILEKDISSFSQFVDKEFGELFDTNKKNKRLERSSVEKGLKK